MFKTRWHVILCSVTPYIPRTPGHLADHPLFFDSMIWEAGTIFDEIIYKNVAYMTEFTFVPMQTLISENKQSPFGRSTCEEELAVTIYIHQG